MCGGVKDRAGSGACVRPAQGGGVEAGQGAYPWSSRWCSLDPCGNAKHKSGADELFWRDRQLMCRQVGLLSTGQTTPHIPGGHGRLLGDLAGGGSQVGAHGRVCTCKSVLVCVCDCLLRDFHGKPKIVTGIGYCTQ